MAQPKHIFKNLVSDGKVVITAVPGTDGDQFVIEYTNIDERYGTPLPPHTETVSITQMESRKTDLEVEVDNLTERIKECEKA